MVLKLSLLNLISQADLFSNLKKYGMQMYHKIKTDRSSRRSYLTIFRIQNMNIMDEPVL